MTRSSPGLHTLADTQIGRRALIGAAAGVLASATSAGAVSAAEGRPSIGEDTRTWLRLVAHVGGPPTLAVLRGEVWGFLPQADDLTTETFGRRLYGYQGLTLRRATLREDGGVVLRSKSWFFYTDIKSGEVITALANPYTGAEVSVPTSSPPPSTTIYGAEPTVEAGPGAPVTFARRRLGPNAWLEQVRLSRFKTPDIDWFKLEADMTTYACKVADLERPGWAPIPSTWSHNLVAEWQTWMKMHGAPGHILFRGEGGLIAGPEDCPPSLRRGLERFYPGALRAAAP